MRFDIQTLLAVVVTAVSATAVPGHSRYAIKESHPVPLRWHQIARAPADEILNLRIGLRHERFAELERHLYEGMKQWSQHDTLLT
jgi:hypothetical protein